MYPSPPSEQQQHNVSSLRQMCTSERLNNDDVQQFSPESSSSPPLSRLPRYTEGDQSSVRHAREYDDHPQSNSHQYVQSSTIPNSPYMSAQRESSAGPRFRNRSPRPEPPSPQQDNSASSQYPSPVTASSQSPFPSFGGDSPNSYTPSPPLPSSLPLRSPLTAPQISKQQKQRLFPVDRKSICVYHEEHPHARQEDIAIRYGVERSTISKILKQKTKWMNVPDQEGMKIAKHRPSKFPAIEEALVDWLVETQKTNTLITDARIRAKAKDTATELQVPDDKFKASSGWVENFKHRHGIRGGVWHGMGKNTRAARALGQGVPLGESLTAEEIMSPLNEATSAFNSDRVETFDASGAPQFVVPSDYGKNERTNNYIPVAGPSNWSTDADGRSEPPLNGYEQQEQSRAHVPMDPPLMHGDTPAVVQVHHLGPTLADAESSVNTLIAFIDKSGPEGLISHDERDALTNIKRALFQAAAGLPFNRG